MKELVFIRHGETDYNRDWKYLGATDIPLNETGKKQAGLISSKLQEESFDAVFCSDLLRCRQTAEIIGFSNDIEINPAFREMNFGVVEGLTYKEIQQKHPDVIKNWDENWYDYTIPGGESFSEVQKRVIDAVESLLQADHKKVGIVTHGGCIRTIMAHYVSKDPKGFYKFNIQNATINRLCFSDKHVFINSINERS